jgi:hypothetical protein
VLGSAPGERLRRQRWVMGATGAHNRGPEDAEVRHCCKPPTAIHIKA